MRRLVAQVDGYRAAAESAPARSSEGRYIDWLTIDDYAKSVVEDVARIRNHPLANKSIPIYGYIYDVNSARLIEVSEASETGSVASARRASSSKGAKPLRPRGGSQANRERPDRAGVGRMDRARS